MLGKFLHFSFSSTNLQPISTSAQYPLNYAYFVAMCSGPESRKPASRDQEQAADLCVGCSAANPRSGAERSFIFKVRCVNTHCLPSLHGNRPLEKFCQQEAETQQLTLCAFFSSMFQSTNKILVGWKLTLSWVVASHLLPMLSKLSVSLASMRSEWLACG